MSHTYHSCYKVTVPPIDIWHSSRRSGVRLREACPPLNELKEFDILYLPKQIHAEYIEQEAERNQRPLPHAPGWKINAVHELDESIARQQRIQNADAELGSDRGLNGSLASKTRYALRHEFSAIRGADGTIVHTVRYQRGANQTRRGNVARAAQEVSADDLLRPSEPLGGIPNWMRVEPKNASLPRSTTHATYRHLPEESFLMDRAHNSGPELLPPPTPCVDSQGQVRPLSPASRTNICRRVPLASNQQPSIFFNIPGKLAHPEFWRKSATLRREREAERQLKSARGDRTMQSTYGAMPPTHLHTSSYPMTARPASHQQAYRSPSPASSSYPTGSHTSRPSTTRPSSLSADLTPSYDSSASAAGTSKFQLHMQRARQRWKEQGINNDDHEEKEQHN